jgi:Na+-transporting methylmalonyl-CoA/oxaloacetate decarboxylase gamma subunit
MMSKFWLYLGIILACSGIGTGLGIFLIILYVWGDIMGAIDNNNVSNNIEEENSNANYYSEETAEEMK